MEIKELRVISLNLINEEIISKIISIQYDKEDDLYIIFYKEDRSEYNMGATIKDYNAIYDLPKHKGRQKKQKKVEDVIKWLGLDFNIIYENDTKWLYKLSIGQTGSYRFKIKDKFDPYDDFTQVKDIMSMTMNQLVNLRPIDYKNRSE